MTYVDRYKPNTYNIQNNENVYENLYSPRSIGVGDGGHEGTCPPPPKKAGKIFFGQLLWKIRAFSGKKNHVKFGIFVNFSGKCHKNSGIF